MRAPAPFDQIGSGVWKAGPDGPHGPVVLLHGWMGTGLANFAHVTGPLAENGPVYVIDLAGHGAGPRLERYDDTSVLTAPVARTMDNLGLVGATVVGFSLGGAVAQQLWRDRPDLVGGLVLSGCSTRLWRSTTERRLLRFAGRLGKTTGRRSRSLGHVLGAPVRALSRRAALAHYRGVGHHDWSALAAVCEAMAAFDSEGWIDGIDIPVVVVAGRRDLVAGVAPQLELARKCRAELVETPGGHTAFITHREPFSVALHDACARVGRER